MNDWNQYFARLEGRLLPISGLRRQLESLGKTALADETCFDVLDVTSNSTRSYTVGTDGKLERVLKASPTTGVRIISISAERTISPLLVTSPMAAKVFDWYDVRPEYLRVLLSFGTEPHQSEANSANSAFVPEGDHAYTLLYKLNFVELNNRGGENPWSFRHVGVYHHHTTSLDLFILLHCHPECDIPGRLEKVKTAAKARGDTEGEEDTEEEEDTAEEDAAEKEEDTEEENAAQEKKGEEILVVFQRELCAHPASLHCFILSSYLDNWRLYLRHLGHRFSNENNRAMVLDGAVNPAPKDPAAHVRHLRNTKDWALFASACCRSNLEVTGCILHIKTLPDAQMFELRSMETMLRGHIESSDGLRQRIDNTVELASYTLTLRGQKELRDLTSQMDKHVKGNSDLTLKLTKISKETGEVILKLTTMTQKTGEVIVKLQELSQKTAKEGTILLILAIISAIYLPGSFVGSIFGSNFFNFNDETLHITVAKDFWIFVLLWLGLTGLTAGAYFAAYQHKPKGKKDEENVTKEKTATDFSAESNASTRI